MTPGKRIAIPGLLALALTGCTTPEGEVEVRVWGEAFIEDGIPAAAMSDGWAVDFDRFEVELRDVTIAGTPIEVVGPFDLRQTSAGVGQLVGRASVPAGEHGDGEFTIVRVTSKAARARPT
jgi:hypothetical protein